MGNKGKNAIFTLAGAYLVYTGGKLFMDVYKAKPNSYALLMIASVVFVIAGIAIIIFYMKDYLKHEKIEEIEDDETESEEVADEETVAEEVDARETVTEEIPVKETEPEQEKKTDSDIKE